MFWYYLDCMKRSTTQSAFSLVELSIVLVILGLLTGGILGGQSLIRAAELRSLTADTQRYSAAVYTFRDKYFGLPGDLTNATSFWGAAADCSAATTTASILTCNGNGNGQIEWSTPSVERSEMHAFWQQMAAAGLVEGSYTGGRVGNGYSAGTGPGVNAPRTRISNGCWSTFTNTFTPTVNLTSVTGTNMLMAGTVYSDGTNPDYCYQPLIKPEEAWNLDTKTDDGRPGIGRVVVWNNLRNPGCASTDDPTTAAYQLNSATVSCSIQYMLY